MANEPNIPPNESGDVSVLEREQTARKVQRPSKYTVVLLNDDFTPMEFVIWVLQKIFNMSAGEAETIMLKVHNEGKGACGSYTYDVAHSKAIQVRALAEKKEYPLACRVEKLAGEE